MHEQHLDSDEASTSTRPDVKVDSPGQARLCDGGKKPSITLSVANTADPGQAVERKNNKTPSERRSDISIKAPRQEQLLMDIIASGCTTSETKVAGPARVVPMANNKASSHTSDCRNSMTLM